MRIDEKPVLGGIVDTQRDQVAILKAFGYSTLDVALHYGLIVTLICLLGSVLGVAGSFVGRALATRLPQQSLRRVFAVFLLVVSAYILVRQ